MAVTFYAFPRQHNSQTCGEYQSYADSICLSSRATARDLVHGPCTGHVLLSSRQRLCRGASGLLMFLLVA